MSHRFHTALILTGILVLALSLLLLAYTFWPVASLHEQVPLPPTYFVPP